MKHLKNAIGIASAALTVMLLTSFAASAEVSADSRTNARPNRIVGLWDVQVSVASCAGGPAFATFPALHQYALGGTGQIVPSTDPSLLSDHLMVWKHLGGNNYLSRFKMYRFDANGIMIGWTEVTNEVSINNNATQYSGSGMAEVYDSNGNFLMASCPYFTGTRFTAE